MKIKPLAVAILACAPIVSYAKSVDHIDEYIVVSATRSEQNTIVTPSHINVIDSAEISAIGASSVTEVLRSQAGIQIKDQIGDGSRASVSLRGFGETSANNVLILVDGRKLNNPTLESALLSSVSLKDVERIEVVHGSSGVLFGDQAVGGVINIITKNPVGQSLSVDFGAGSHDLMVARLNYSQAFDNGIGVKFSAEDKSSDNYRDNNASDYKNVLAQVRLDKEWGNLFFEYQNINDDLELPGSLSNTAVENDREQSNNNGEFSDNHIEVNRLGGRFNISDTLYLEGDFSTRDSNGYAYLWGSYSHKDTRVETISPRLIGKWDLSNGTLHTTLGYELIKSDYQRGTSNDWEQEQKSWYGQVVVPIVDRLSMTLGVRNTEVEDKDLLGNKKNDDSQTATEIGFSYQLNDQSRVFIRNAESFRFANIDENGFTLPSVGFLDVQTSDSIEAGYEWYGDKASFSLLVYELETDDELYFDSGVPNPLSWDGDGANVNLESSKRKGLSLEASYDFTSDLSLRGSYTEVKAEVTAGSFDGNDVPFVPENTASLAAVYQLPLGLSLYVDAIYTGNRYLADDDANSTDKLGGYVLYNTNLKWSQQNWAANLRVNNLTGKEYSSYQASWGQYPAAERIVEMNVSYTF